MWPDVKACLLTDWKCFNHLITTDMEDAHTHILSLPGDQDTCFFGVFDGHGGWSNCPFCMFFCSGCIFLYLFSNCYYFMKTVGMRHVFAVMQLDFAAQLTSLIIIVTIVFLELVLREQHPFHQESGHSVDRWILKKGCGQVTGWSQCFGCFHTVGWVTVRTSGL